RATLDQHHARLGPGDQVELLFVDERGDLLQALVGPAEILLLHAQPPSRDPNGGSGAAGQRRSSLVAEALPAAGPGPHPAALRSVDPAQLGVGDHQAATDQHGALDAALVELLLVLVALFVAVVEPRDRGVAPVDDRHAV